jgi:AraC-like DNA-binding protein
MPGKRQIDPVVIRTLAVRHTAPYTIPPHTHSWSQLIYSHAGAITVHTAAGSWVVPPDRGVWVPAGMTHSMEMSGQVSMRSLYFAPGLSASLVRRGLPKACSVVNISPLMRELILHANGTGGAALDRSVPAQARLIAVILDQMSAMAEMPLQLPVPRDARAARAAEILRAEIVNHGGVPTGAPHTAALHKAPDRIGPRSLDRLARETGAGKRTLERKFRAETGMGIGRWRQQLRLLHALRLLAEGQPVTSVALEVGYQSTSAFISMFKKAMGSTPFRYRTAPSQRT